MRAVWNNDVSKYHGEQIDFGPMYSRPKPIQAGGPPIHVGGVFPGALRRAVAYGNGWMPIGGRGADGLAEQLRAVDSMCAEAGRDRSTFEVSMYAAPTTRDGLDQLEQMGVDRAVFILPPAGEDELTPILDNLASLIR